MSAVADVLRAARERVARGWCQGVDARDRSRRSVDPWSKSACRWCMMGSLHAEDRPSGYENSALQLLKLAIGEGFVTCWNDAKGRTQAEVIAAFDKAIALAESSP